MLVWFQSTLNSAVPGTRPTFTNIQTLLQFNGSTANSGAWATALNTRGTVTYSSDIPFGSGQSAVFNGSAGLFAATGPISGTGAYSLACWVKPTTLSANAYLIAQRDSENTGQFSLIVGPSGISFTDGTNTTVTGISYLTPITVGRWTHLAAVRANGVMRLYVDGIQVATFNKTAPSIQTSNGLAIGYDQRDNVSSLNGRMKDVIVANRELTADEILWMAKSFNYFPTT